MARSKPLKPVKLHHIISTSTVWTDELWDEALSYLLETTGTLEVLTMYETLGHNDHYARAYPHKIDYLREFRQYPPTTLLGAFDLMRLHRARLGGELSYGLSPEQSSERWLMSDEGNDTVSNGEI